jgi:predicted O-methyltransferase YrrM
MSSESSVITRSVAQHFLENLRKSLDMDALANLVQLDIDQLEQQVDMSIAEAMQTLSLLHGFPYRPGSRALEVGAGFGFASLALASFGY